MTMTPWERLLYLAREVDEASRTGALDPALAARLARAVLEFQKSLVGRAYAIPPAASELGIVAEGKAR